LLSPHTALSYPAAGKTTFIRMLAGLLKPDVEPGKPEPEIKGFSVSYKPQKISPSFEGSVRALLFSKIKEAYAHPQFNSDVVKPLNLDPIIDQEVKNLSGGELQRVALALCLGKPADVYLIDEPSAYLDSEQRIVASKIIKRFILHAKKTAFIVEHDFIMATYLADRVIVYTGEPGMECTATAPQSLLSGMNQFLKVRHTVRHHCCMLAGSSCCVPQPLTTPSPAPLRPPTPRRPSKSLSAAILPTSGRASTSTTALKTRSRRRRALISIWINFKRQYEYAGSVACTSIAIQLRSSIRHRASLSPMSYGSDAVRLCSASSSGA
jgi:ABC-type Mn2+/Zn2+ transport system ATPase subunit